MTGSADAERTDEPDPPPAARMRSTPTADRPVAVVDIDGVVADVRHRLAALERRPRDWNAFFAGAAADPLLPEGLAVVRRLEADHDVVFLSGRPERLRVLTETWLRQHGLPGETLLLRRDGDHRPARVVKLGQLRRLAATRPIGVVVDDDPDVCAAVQIAGFPVLVADWVPRPAPLTVAQRGGRT